ncbi:MAG: hypothetical protein K2X69_15425 [Silvanigrellaceae bacterium]|nr:hypothetical protein [Silvanigrellaceae bacterium]
MIEWNDLKENNLEKIKNPKKKILITSFYAILITFIQFLIFKSISQSSNPNQNMKSILIAKSNLVQGHIVNENDFKLSEINSSELSSFFIESDQIDRYIGKKILIPIKENTPLLKNLFMSPFQKNSVPEKIPYGKRLFVLDIDFGNYGTILKIGDKIDLIAHLNIPNFGKVTETILQNIKIVGINDEIEEKINVPSANSISFYIYPEEVKIITFMKQYANFSISLRNPNDNIINKDEAITLNKFIENEHIQKIIKNDSFQFIPGLKK